MTPTVESANFSVGRHKFDGRRRGKKVLHPSRDISEKALTVVELCDPGSELRLRGSRTGRAKKMSGMGKERVLKKKKMYCTTYLLLSVDAVLCVSLESFTGIALHVQYYTGKDESSLRFMEEDASSLRFMDSVAGQQG